MDPSAGPAIAATKLMTARYLLAKSASSKIWRTSITSPSSAALELFVHLPARPYRTLALIVGCHARLDDIERVKASVAECLAMKPHFSIDHYMSKEPFKFAADAAHLAESLQMAGLPH